MQTIPGKTIPAVGEEQGIRQGSAPTLARPLEQRSRILGLEEQNARRREVEVEGSLSGSTTKAEVDHNYTKGAGSKSNACQSSQQETEEPISVAPSSTQEDIVVLRSGTRPSVAKEKPTSAALSLSTVGTMVISSDDDKPAGRRKPRS